MGSLVAFLYPHARYGEDYEITVSGEGASPEITRWDEGVLGPLPTAAELVAARVPILKREKKVALSGEAKALTAQRFAIGFADEEFQALTAARALGQAADPRLVEAVQLAARVRAAYAKVDAIADDDPEAGRKIGEVTL
jgi:hypothetical protein